MSPSLVSVALTHSNKSMGILVLGLMLSWRLSSPSRFGFPTPTLIAMSAALVFQELSFDLIVMEKSPGMEKV